MRHPAGLTGLLIAAALLSACETIAEAPAEAEPAQPPIAIARNGGGPIAGSPTRGTSPAPPPAAASAAEAPAEAEPAQPPIAIARSGGGPIAGSPTRGTSPAPPPVAPPAPAPAPAPALALAPAPAPAPPVPHIYMALQPGGAGGPVSAVFAIDAARDNTPSDDPAVRLTPESGLCNPQEMRSYDFAPEDAARPVVSEAEQAEGLTARDLPAFMAVSVTDRMLRLGLASDREQTRSLNVCTRKLWERLVAAGN